MNEFDKMVEQQAIGDGHIQERITKKVTPNGDFVVVNFRDLVPGDQFILEDHGNPHPHVYTVNEAPYKNSKGVYTADCQVDGE